MDIRTVIVDVREDIRTGREPFSRIMQAVGALRPNEQLQVIAPFEPVPLFRVLEKHGFSHQSQPTASGDWKVLFTHASQESAIERTDTAPCTCLSTYPTPAMHNEEARIPEAVTKIVDVDARGLEPPQPMVKILEAVATLPAGQELRARTDRRPMHLYPQLDERGFAATTEEQPDGSFLTHIRRN